MSGALRRCATAEWIKLRTLSATYIALACAAVLGIGVGALDTHSVTAHWTTMSPQDRATLDAVGESFFGLQFGQLAFGVIGVLVMSGEYGTGMIRATLLATPRRGRVFFAKSAVLATTTLIAGEALAFITFAVGQRMLAPQHLGVGVNDAGVARAVASAGLYLAVVSIVGMGVGAVVRHAAGAIAVLFGLIFLSWPAARAVEGWSYLPDRLLLSNAADVLAQVHATAPKPRLPSLGGAYLDLALYLVVALSVGFWRARRDP
jgi:hypothetical protein